MRNCISKINFITTNNKTIKNQILKNKASGSKNGLNILSFINNPFMIRIDNICDIGIRLFKT